MVLLKVNGNVAVLMDSFHRHRGRPRRVHAMGHDVVAGASLEASRRAAAASDPTRQKAPHHLVVADAGGLAPRAAG